MADGFPETTMTLTLRAILAAHAAGRRVVETIQDTYARIEAHDDPALFITLRPKAEALAAARALDAAGPAGKPLFGVPFAVKDNIDVAGLPTTCACPAFAYHPEKSSFVVERLERAGAIVVGKTNLDQFATGLVGMRSPYGAPRNALRADLIPGGSSSGSAVAVGAGLTPFSLGTDTAGSGRVPAALNGIVGLKPTLGALSASRPAKRSIRSRFSRSTSRTRSPYSRSRPATTRPTPIRSRCRRRASSPGRTCESASRARTSARSSATTSPGLPTRPTLSGSKRSAPRSSHSTWSRSIRWRARSMRGRGSPSAIRR
jgi:hypothetical protein